MAIRINCSRFDCAFHHGDGKSSIGIICAHPEKIYYMRQFPCPLYRLNWENHVEKASEVEQYLKELKKKEESEEEKKEEREEKQETEQ